MTRFKSKLHCISPAWALEGAKMNSIQRPNISVLSNHHFKLRALWQNAKYINLFILVQKGTFIKQNFLFCLIDMNSIQSINRNQSIECTFGRNIRPMSQIWEVSAQTRFAPLSWQIFCTFHVFQFSSWWTVIYMTLTIKFLTKRLFCTFPSWFTKPERML